jgi:DNA-binding Xre family transcriptional regulator
MGNKPVRVDLEQVKATVDTLLDKRKLTEKWLYERIQMSKNGYREMWERGSVKATALQDLADAFGVQLDQLLTGEAVAAQVAAEPAAGYGRSRFLEERVDELEARMQALERIKA